MLHDPDRHETLTTTGWDPARAQAALRAIVAEAEAACTAPGGWPVHPLDADDETVPSSGFKSLYLGSAGVLWALWALQRAGAVGLRLDPLEGLLAAERAYFAEPDTGAVVPSYFLGETGLLLARWCLTREPAVAERLHAAVEGNLDHPSNEALWGAPGTMVAAWHLWRATHEERWRTLFLANVDRLWSTWRLDETAGCHLWTQDLYGKVVQYIGAGHGFAGNVYPLLEGAALLDAQRRDQLYERCAATACALALQEPAPDGTRCCNWRPGTFEPRPGGAGLLMQWCHGAPGMVTALAAFPPGRSAEMDALLVGAGHAVWHAGPLAKGHGLCHGTAGNGYAFLKLHRRGGEALWLERARAFAMHAIEQCDRMRARYGCGRYNLWTGDLGLAIYLWHCVHGGDALPALDAPIDSLDNVTGPMP